MIEKLEINELKGMNYCEYKPEDFDANKKYPLMIFLHGAGEREKLEDVAFHGPLCSIKNGMKIDAVILCPHCFGNDFWNSYLERLKELVELYQTKSYIDVDRISITGLSMGGYGTLDLALMDPSYFSALLVVCGGGKPFTYQHFKDLPCWFIHGDKDNVVDPSESVKMYDKIKQINDDCHLTIHKGYDHNVWDVTYNDINMINWLLSQKRKNK